MFTDKFGSKIPAVIGLVLLAYTFYDYSFLSYLSMKSQIMVPLYIRGVALGLTMAPLTAAAISEMPNQKMAQASGLINVIRQVGGSFGVALFGTLLTRNTILHAAGYGEQINQYSDVYRNTVAKLHYFSVHATGGTFGQAATKADALIALHVHNQAFISAIDEVFFLAGIVVLISVIPVFFLRNVTRKKGPGAPALE
jgi:DHA2 family multidrug resistance protein